VAVKLNCHLRPCKASARLARGLPRGKWRVMAKGGICAGACAKAGDVCEWGAFMLSENYGWVLLWGGGLLSRVFALDERFSGHPHICHRAKFEWNWKIRSWVIAIELIQFDRCPPSLISKESIFGPLHNIVGPHCLRTHQLLVKISWSAATICL